MSKKSPTTKRVDTLKAYQDVFNSASGTKVLLDLMKTHNMLNSSFNENVNTVIFKEGERNVVLRILSILNTDVSSLLERIKQHEQDME